MDYLSILKTIVESLRQGEKVRAVVAAPYSAEIVQSVKRVYDDGFLSELIFVGEREKIPVADNFFTLVEKFSDEDIAVTATEAARRPGSIIIKGKLSSSTLLKAVLKGSGGKRVASHVYIIDSKAFPGRAILTTDAGVNIKPDVGTKAKIVDNALSVAHAVGYQQPKVAILSAVETINSHMQGTLDASSLCAMAAEGRFGDAVLAGPMALDAALLQRSATIKGMSGPVAGSADILVLDDIEAGNSTSKALIGEFGDAMGVIVGAGVPVAFPSRGDSETTRYHSLLLAAYLSQRH
ncbi:MAG: phosphate acetyltransferase [Gammaproteobacteria bacterium]|nr:phosphate acetyltransferase [Gammaproteobacteria bacterium]